MEKLILGLSLFFQSNIFAFCGFYVAKADTSLFNKASKVVMVRDENKTVMTMVNDFQGEAKEFATVIPVPTVLEKEQIHVTENKIIDHLDAYSAPRLVEYHDPNPCEIRVFETMAMKKGGIGGSRGRAKSKRGAGVKVEAQYQIGEYDILILSAKESGGLQEWLEDNGYKIPTKAKKILGSYIKQGLKFFVAKVNLKEHSKLGYNYLRPIQVAYESKRFMLPIRLGTVNAKDDQELFVFALTRKGRVETTNYRTLEIPSNMDIPTYLKDSKKFADFYTSMFNHASQKEGKKVVFMEYAWDMNWCDPCAADPLSNEELRELGVFWVNKEQRESSGFNKKRRIMPQAKNVFITRLHLKYNAETFPEDLKFNVTNNRSNFQGRYIMRHPFKGKMDCEAGKRYEENLSARLEKEMTTLAHLTGWDKTEIQKQMDFVEKKEDSAKKKWWQKIWN